MAKITMTFDHDNGELFTENWTVTQVKNMVKSMMREMRAPARGFTVEVTPTPNQRANDVLVKFRNGKTAGACIGFAWGRFVCEPDDMDEFLAK